MGIEDHPGNAAFSALASGEPGLVLCLLGCEFGPGGGFPGCRGGCGGLSCLPLGARPAGGGLALFRDAPAFFRLRALGFRGSAGSFRLRAGAATSAHRTEW
ncbi:hypothetical protein ACIRSU_12980 [Streptomyces sp. NPDC101160]|uniref:hypothetical protein n=1 Tax=Streptomyces sp. NPDC101160 TaxID=3366118 RepID=UPI00382DED53